jgi:hypothetical protein
VAAAADTSLFRSAVPADLCSRDTRVVWISIFLLVPVRMGDPGIDDYGRRLLEDENLEQTHAKRNHRTTCRPPGVRAHFALTVE